MQNKTNFNLHTSLLFYYILNHILYKLIYNMVSMPKNNLFIFTLLILLSCVVSLSQYKVQNITTNSSTIFITAKYEHNDLKQQQSNNNKKEYNKQKVYIIQEIIFTFHMLTYNDFYFTIRDKNQQRFQIPQEGIFVKDPYKGFSYPLNLSVVGVSYKEDYFDFRIYRRTTNETIFSTYQTKFLYQNYLIQIGTQLSTKFTFGLGERFNRNLRVKEGSWTMFNRGRGQLIDDGKGYQTYGYYPFYLQRQKPNNYHVGYLRTSNALDVIKVQKDTRVELNFKIIGGIVDFRYFVGGNSPTSALDKFQTYVGNSLIPPFWSLGFHQARFGYSNITAYENVIKGYQNNNLPLDTLWLDIDYMIDYEDFTIDEKRFPLDKLKIISEKYKIIPIIDAGIKVDSSSYQQGKKRDVFIKDAKGQQFQGLVWPGQTTFVDFFHPNSTKYWADMLQTLYKKVNLSGIWLDMNQYMNFCNGPCDPPQYERQFDYSTDLPYNPGSDNIQTFTLSLNATHYGNKKQADVHVYAGMMQTYATYQWLKTKFASPFVLSRSTTIGSHKYGFHWTGDNYADFQFLKSSIPDNLLHQMWGMQMVGADICGFGGNTTVQLCSRWFQLGSLYPFARNHNTLRANPQQPYSLGETVLKSAQNNIKLRYSLLHYLYSSFMRQQFGHVWKPLFMQFCNDENNFRDDVMDTQFLIGSNLMATPILQQGTTSRSVYFTTQACYNLYSGKYYQPGQSQITNISLTDKIPLFIRSNSSILIQNTQNVTNTYNLPKTYHLVAALKKKTDTQIQSYMQIPSIQNFHNHTQVNQCVVKQSLYIFYMVFHNNINELQIKIITTYPIGTNLQQNIIIDQITAYYSGYVFYSKLEIPINIRGNGIFRIKLQLTNNLIQNSNKHVYKDSFDSKTKLRSQ